MYGRQSSESVLQYIHNVQITAVSQSVNRNVAINSTIYFSQYNETQTSTGRYYEFSEKVRVEVQNAGPGNLSYKLIGTISQQITVLTFLIDLINTGIAQVSDGKLEINSAELNDSFKEKVQGTLKYLRDVETLFKSFDIDPDQLNISSFEKRDFANLGFLLDVFVHKRRKETTPLQNGFNVVKVGDISLGVFVYKKVDDSNYTTFDLFGHSEKLKFWLKTDEDVDIAVSMYVILKQDTLTLVDNLVHNQAR